MTSSRKNSSEKRGKILQVPASIAPYGTNCTLGVFHANLWQWTEVYLWLLSLVLHFKKMCDTTQFKEICSVVILFWFFSEAKKYSLNIVFPGDLRSFQTINHTNLFLWGLNWKNKELNTGTKLCAHTNSGYFFCSPAQSNNLPGYQIVHLEFKDLLQYDGVSDEVAEWPQTCSAHFFSLI